MIKQIVFSAFVIVIGILCINNKASTSSGGAAPGYTGAPGDVNDCTQCHSSFAVNSGTASISITGLSYYIPGQTYSITVSIFNFLNPKNGFEIVVLEDAGNTEIGTLSITDFVNTKTVPGATRYYVTHTMQGTNLSSWTFNWTAPSTDVGSITFYAAVNDANSNFNSFGDYIYTTSLTVTTCSAMNISSSVTDVNCNGSSNGSIDVTIAGGVPPMTYSWSNGASTQDISGLSAGVYTVTVTDNQNCTSELTVSVNEPAALDASIFTLDTTAYCNVYGGGVLLESAPNPNVTKQWFKKTNPIPGATGDTYFANSEAWYRLQVTDANGCTKKDNAIVVTQLPKPPAILTVIGDLSFCGGGSVTLQANAGPYTYQWLKAGRNYPGRTDPTLVTDKTGKYKVSVINQYGCYRISNEVRVVRWQKPKSVVTPTTAQLPSPICDGDSILLTCTPSRGTPPYTYQWIRYTTNIPGANGATYLSTNKGGYSCRVIDSNGCAQKSFPRTVINETCRLGNTEYEFADNLDLVAYPNPFKNEVTLALNNFTDDIVKIIIRDELGRVIYNKVDKAQFEYQINTAAYRTGIYFVEIQQDKNIVRVKMLKY